ncbi:MAG: histidine--tRNA ligase [Alphaproteobacteria bacterium]
MTTSTPTSAPAPLKLTGAISGFPELLPAQQRAFQTAVERVRGVYESFGFTPLETAAVERIDTLLSKGISAKEVYGLRRLAAEDEDSGAKDLALRFDLTVPLARYVVQNMNDLVFPFRRYQVQPVWRGERAQKGRYRQFYQFDIDTIGDTTLPLAADAEILAAAVKALTALNIGPFTLRVNNRKLLQGLLTWADIHGDNQQAAIKLIDDAEKIGWDKTLAGLRAFSCNEAEALVELLRDPNPLDAIKRKINFDKVEGYAELTTVLALARTMAGLPEGDTTIQPDLTIARGLDYYTGTVVETKLHAAPELGSICSGGRYDNLTASLGKKTMPGVGISIGISRLCAWMLTQPAYQLPATPARVLVACQDESLLAHYAHVAATLRAAGIATEQALGGALGTQLKNAAKRGVAFAVIIGQPEYATGEALVKNLATTDQTKTPLAEVVGVVG